MRRHLASRLFNAQKGAAWSTFHSPYSGNVAAYSLHRSFSTGPDLPTEVDAVIVGGGMLGASTAYHLTQRGISTLLLERHQLTAGTTWHSAGMLWRLRPSDVDIELHDYTRYMCKKLEEETEVGSWTENGGLFIACNAERLAEYQRLSETGKYYGIESHVLTPSQARDVYPLLNVDDVYGALYSPSDGTIDPNGIVMAYSKALRKMGGRIREGVGVQQVLTEQYDTPGGDTSRRVTGVVTECGQHVKAKILVNACGAWANELAAMAGVRIPLCAMKHAMVTTETIEGVHPGLPNVRDHDLSIYLKTQGDAICIGGYERNPEFWNDVDPGFSFGLFDLDWDTFEQNLTGHIQRCPAIAEAGIKSTVCGPESFTPDHKPLVGPQPGLRGFYNACGFNSMGMMLGGGMGRELATWIDEGSPSLDMFSYDCSRFHPASIADRKWVKDRTHESYAKTYAIVFPHDEALAGRGNRKSALYDELLQRGCVYQARHGFERPGWFEPGADVAVKEYDFYGAYAEGGGWRLEAGLEEVAPHSAAHRYHEMIDAECTFAWPRSHELVAAEVAAARTGVALFDQSYFGKFFVEGPGAAGAVAWLCAAPAEAKPVGSVTYTPLCNRRGGVEADLTVTRLAADRFYFAAGGNTMTKDLMWIRSVIEDRGFACTVRDASDDYVMLSVQGPHSLALLQPLVTSPHPLTLDSLPFSCMVPLEIAGKPLMCLRLTFVGELGYELHVPSEHAGEVYRAVAAAGEALEARLGVPVRNAGYRAIDTLSAEKGYRHWHADLTNRDTPFEAAIGFTVGAKLKTDVPYLGRAALEAQKASGVQRKLVCLVLDDPDVPLHGLETIWRDGACVGVVRSTAFGHSLSRSIAYGYVQAPPDLPKITNDWLKAGQYSVGDKGALHAAALHLKAPFDPLNERIKGIYPALAPDEKPISAVA